MLLNDAVRRSTHCLLYLVPTTREVGGRKVVLPVWHEITADEVRRYSPMLADRVATSSGRGLSQVVTDLLIAMGKSMPVG